MACQKNTSLQRESSETGREGKHEVKMWRMSPSGGNFVYWRNNIADSEGSPVCSLTGMKLVFK